MDCYENFGWKQDENFPPQNKGDIENAMIQSVKDKANIVKSVIKIG